MNTGTHTPPGAGTELEELAESVVADGATPGEGLDTALWAVLEQTGLVRLTLPEAAGGSGGSHDDATAVLGAVGAYGARVPLAETDVAAWSLHAAGIAVPEGPLAVAPPPAELYLDGDRGTGTLRAVPHGRSVAGVVVVADAQVVLVDPAAEGITVTPGTNLAEEPRDTLVLEGAPIVVADAADTVAELVLRAALGRAQLLAGAARGALAMTVRYVGERVQFGRPIGRFQAVQQQLAICAAEVAAARAAAGSAARTADADGFGADSTALAVAAAKARTGEAAGAVARIAHQLHGAIGFTREHDLRLTTTRLWAWREEDGTEAHWQRVLGDRALAAGPDGLWPLLTGTP
jgi:acyl-CoA dehydrogenase